MHRRALLVLFAGAVACSAIALAAYFSSSTPSAVASRAADSSPSPATITATPCPTDTAPSFPPGGCGTFTPTPTSVRLPPMLTIDFTVNGAHDQIMIIQGQFMTIQTAYRNIDNRGITIDDTVDLTNGGGHGAGHCYISPGSSCSEGGGFSANDFGTMTATLRLIAQVEGCGFCPTLEKEDSIVIDVIARGDFNCSSAVNSIDAALILQLTAALIQPFACTGAGDVNHDGYTNAVDALLVLQYVAGLIASL